ncbi:MAG TPA: PAS domain S-box protein [Bryobacteraceae bacterium]
MANSQRHTVAVSTADPAKRLSLVPALEKEGHRVVVSTNLERVLAAPGDPPPDLVVAGLDPPDLDAWRLCGLLRSSAHPAWNRVPILLVSASLCNEDSRAVTARLGGNGLLPFPVDEELLLRRVRGLLEGEAATDETAGRSPAEEGRFRRAVQDSGAGHFHIDADGRYQWVNDAWLQMHGYVEAAEIAGRHFSVVHLEADQEKAREIVTQVLAGTPVPAGEFRRKRKDGSVGYHTFSAHPVKEGAGVVGLEGFLIDTTAFHRLEERSQMLFSQMLDGFALQKMIFDAEGKPADCRFLAVNRAFEEMTGLPAERCIGRTVLEMLPGTEAHWIENFGKVALTGEPLRFESSHAGLNKHFEVHAFRPQEGQVACIFRDISELKARVTEIEAMAEQMRKRAEDYRAIFEGALEGMFRTSAEGLVLAANPALAKMLGYESEVCFAPAITVPAHQAWADPEDRSRFLQAVEQEGSVRGYECRLRRKDGTVIWASASCRKVVGPDGETACYEGFVEDITARKRAEDQLRISENKFRMAFMTGADALSISTLQDGLLLDVNDRYAEVLGYSRDEARGRTVTELGVYADSDRQRLLSELAAKGHAEDTEFQIRRKDGELRSVLVSANSLESDAGELLLAATRDITEQKRAEAERLKLEEQFRQSQKLESIGRLAGGVAHDFNNLLTIINGYGDLLLGEYQNGNPLRKWVEEIRQAGERAANLTRQLLAFSRKQSVEPLPMYLRSVVAENQAMLRRLIGEDIELVVESDPAECLVMADPGQLHQVLMNLAVNAMDAMPRGGTLTIRTANVEVDEAYTAAHPEIAPGPYVSLLVSDTGVGIEKEHQPHIFDPFFTTKAEGEGTGLGLSTVYGIVRQLNGSIAVTSEPGRGAAFEVYLPRLDQAEVVAGAQAAGVTPSSRGTETVLVVEDQLPVRHLAMTLLKERGYAVLDAAQGSDALLVAERHPGPIHLLLTDVDMPHMTGKELAERLMPLRPEMKVLYMSGYAADVMVRHQWLESGTPYLAKPFAPDALAVKVREALGPPRLAASILVVDDEGSVRGLFEHVLTGAGYEVEVARDGAEALRKIRARRFDLLLTDLVMPEKEGLDIIGILHQERPDLKVVAVSGAFGGKFLKAAQLLGANAVLLKPVSPDRLLVAVQGALS